MTNRQRYPTGPQNSTVCVSIFKNIISERVRHSSTSHFYWLRYTSWGSCCHPTCAPCTEANCFVETWLKYTLVSVYMQRRLDRNLCVRERDNFRGSRWRVAANWLLDEKSEVSYQQPCSLRSLLIVSELPSLPQQLCIPVTCLLFKTLQVVSKHTANKQGTLCSDCLCSTCTCDVATSALPVWEALWLHVQLVYLPVQFKPLQLQPRHVRAQRCIRNKFACGTIN